MSNFSSYISIYNQSQYGIILDWENTHAANGSWSSKPSERLAPGMHTNFKVKDNKNSVGMSHGTYVTIIYYIEGGYYKEYPNKLTYTFICSCPYTSDNLVAFQYPNPKPSTTPFLVLIMQKILVIILSQMICQVPLPYPIQKAVTPSVRSFI